MVRVSPSAEMVRVSVKGWGIYDDESSQREENKDLLITHHHQTHSQVKKRLQTANCFSKEQREPHLSSSSLFIQCFYLVACTWSGNHGNSNQTITWGHVFHDQQHIFHHFETKAAHYVVLIQATEEWSCLCLWCRTEVTHTHLTFLCVCFITRLLL